MARIQYLSRIIVVVAVFLNCPSEQPQSVLSDIISGVLECCLSVPQRFSTVSERISSTQGSRDHNHRQRTHPRSVEGHVGRKHWQEKRCFTPLLHALDMHMM